jgi:hypothetical protein
MRMLMKGFNALCWLYFWIILGPILFGAIFLISSLVSQVVSEAIVAAKHQQGLDSYLWVPGKYDGTGKVNTVWAHSVEEARQQIKASDNGGEVTFVGFANLDGVPVQEATPTPTPTPEVRRAMRVERGLNGKIVPLPPTLPNGKFDLNSGM